MDNRELMRGDYVMFFNSRKIGKIAKVDQILRNSCLLLYNNFPDETEYYNEIIVNNEDIHPIKLTKEIFTKNNFGFNGIMYIYNNIAISPYFDKWSIGFFELLENGRPNMKLITYIANVHELQNLLNVLDIKIDFII